MRGPGALRTSRADRLARAAADVRLVAGDGRAAHRAARRRARAARGGRTARGATAEARFIIRAAAARVARECADPSQAIPALRLTAFAAAAAHPRAALARAP